MSHERRMEVVAFFAAAAFFGAGFAGFGDNTSARLMTTSGACFGFFGVCAGPFAGFAGGFTVPLATPGCFCPGSGGIFSGRGGFFGCCCFGRDDDGAAGVGDDGRAGDFDIVAALLAR